MVWTRRITSGKVAVTPGWTRGVVEGFPGKITGDPLVLGFLAEMVCFFL